MFREIVETERCAIIVDGYFEWKQNVKGAQNKTGTVPYFISFKTPMILAALKMEDKVVLMTQQSIDCLSDIHHRMPVFLDKETIGPWLDSNSFNEVEKLIKNSKIWPLFYEVSDQVNSVKNDSKDVIIPRSEYKEKSL